MRKAEVRISGKRVGQISETESGYAFVYDSDYATNQANLPVSKTLPLQRNAYTSNVLFPFFDGLIPEGWLLDIAERNWKLNARDRFGLLMQCCKDCIGTTEVVAIESD
ncbi:MAG: HipA N-terminal domain-containing protein [Flavobacteriales bacterium]|nr:HipA N-terminal domain-containing protein [Flavobacteriales bacterium]